MKHEETRSSLTTIEEVKAAAVSVADAMKAAAPGGKDATPGGGSRHRGLPEELRRRFIDVRTALFQRGIYDPVLVRFDSATAPKATAQEIGEQLADVAQSL